MNMTQNAQRQINVVAPFENLKRAYLNLPANLKEKLTKTIEIRIVTESHELDTLTGEIMRYSEASNNRIELRQNRKIAVQPHNSR